VYDAGGTLAMTFDIPQSYRPYLRLGTCSWKYDSWKGLIYDKGKNYKANDYLKDYAQHLNSVEVDQWFWSLFPGSVRLPDPGIVKIYADSVPVDFKFTIKAPNALTLTHFYAKREAGTGGSAGKPNEFFLSHTLLSQFLERLMPLGKKLGPIMFQFEYLNKRKMPSREAFFDAFGAFIEKAPKEFQYAVEIRNPNYLSPPFFQFLKERRLGFVYLEGYYMPRIGDIFSTYNPATADFSIIRLHGGGRKEIETETGEIWDTIIAPKPEAIQATVQITEEYIRKKITTYVNVNNHFEGSAPLTIDRFLKALKQS
jgi:uncharacterized protein YecE (DUF72 family)